MPIVPSRSGRIQELLGRLASGGPAERDSAVAGLTLLGVRVVEPLRAILPTANQAARLAALEVLDRIEDHAALAPLLDLVRDEGEPVAQRAMEAVGGRPDPRAAKALARVLAGRGAPAIPALQKALERLGPLGRGGGDASSLRARAAIHETLAALDSRVALYDLRETIATCPRAVMPTLIRAAGRVGDGSLVPVLARAVAEDTALLDACAGALAAIVAREKLRKTSAACKSVRPDDRGAFLLLWERAKAPRPR